MKIEVERVYKIKMMSGSADADDDVLDYVDVPITKSLFKDVEKLNDANKDYTIFFIFDKNLLKEVRIKTQYIDVKKKEIEELQETDENTIKTRIKKEIIDKSLMKNLWFISKKETQQKKTVSKLKQGDGLWKWRLDVFCSSLLNEDLTGESDLLYKAVKEFLFGAKNPTKAKF